MINIERKRNANDARHIETTKNETQTTYMNKNGKRRNEKKRKKDNEQHKYGETKQLEQTF